MIRVILQKVTNSVELYIQNISNNSLNSFLSSFNIPVSFELSNFFNFNSNIQLNNHYLPSFNSELLRPLFEPTIIQPGFSENSLNLPNPRLYSFSNVSFYIYICSKKVIFIIVNISLLFISFIVYLLFNIINSTINIIQHYIKKLPDNSKQKATSYKTYNHTMLEGTRSRYETHAKHFPKEFGSVSGGDGGDDGRRPNEKLASPHYYVRFYYPDLPGKLQSILIRTHEVLEKINTEGVVPDTIERNGDVFAQISIELHLLRDHPTIKNNRVIRNIYLNIID